ncbi:PhaM family polyhydroxyalkanoate granule multifunctional regulatory protein [Variovorax sp. PAMC 28711]|uniref:PhaM family polyhydroxyalkanoate granule multifunctional regulatory protein n=1 Tax=Variovorax sp. PAMC 28711 TaxID=1795631 RepID=UPI00078D9F38|nr:PhaM family polyhydroxyalkanoate granule multifunctional regulatory protein [Variovorax sp. PAMC 28711]AMM24343.1 hypothetical protein AX767_08265 [Variovorax sp. PAMC 28711]
MSDTAKPFAFSQFVPGFDFLKNLTTGGGSGSGSAIPGLSNWVAPTLSVEEVDKRIQELKTVQYWLEQNGHALKATIQALEVQKMTLSTLRGMNVRMEDIASAFTRAAAPAAATTPAPEPEPEPQAEPEAKSADMHKTAEPAAPGVVDPLKWWGSLTQQFQQIAASALQDAAHLKMPAAAEKTAPVARKRATAKKAPAKTSTAARKRPASKR